MGTHTDPTEKRWLWVAGLVTALIYARAIGHGFVNFDDNIHLYENPHFTPLRWAGWLDLLSSPYKQLFIPTIYSFWAGLAALCTLLFGEPFPPALFHAVGVALHLLIGALLVFPLCRDLLGDAKAAAVGTALFWLHPLNVEAVAWVSGQKDLVATGLGLLCLRLALAKPSRGRVLGSVVALVLAVLAKPSAAAIPAMGAVLGWGYGKLPTERAARLALGGTLVVLPFLVVTARLQAGGPLPFVPPPFFARFPLALEALGFYTVKTALPWPLLIDHGWTPATGLGSFYRVLCFAAGMATVTFTAWGIARGERAAYAAAATLVALIPVSGIMPFVHQTMSTVADRYLYLPFLGVALLGGEAYRRRPRAKELAVPAIGVFALLALFQVGVWKSSRTLYGHALSLRPNSWLAHNNLGSAMEIQNDLEGAREHYIRSAELFPQAETWNNVAVVDLKRGRIDDALLVLRHGLSLFPRSPSLMNNLGTALARKGDIASAREAFRAALAIDPRLTAARENLDRLAPASGKKG